MLAKKDHFLERRTRGGVGAPIASRITTRAPPEVWGPPVQPRGRSVPLVVAVLVYGGGSGPRHAANVE